MGPMNTERRNAHRVSCWLPVRLTIANQSVAIETLTKNVGLGGLKCVSPIEHPVSSLVTVELSISNALERLRFRGRLAWFEIVPHSEQFFLGIAFTEYHSDSRRHLSAYLDKFLIRPQPVLV